MVTLAIFVLTFVCSVSGQSTCPGRIGRNDTIIRSARRDDRFYINRDDPATCDGNITSISYCYFRPDKFDSDEIDDYVTPIAVYRPQGDGRYTAVSPTIQLRKTLTDVETELGEVDFVCSVLTLDQPVTVQSGDVLGACVGDVDDEDVLYPFHIVGQSRPNQGLADGDLLRETETSAGCTATSAPSNIDVSRYSDSTDVFYLSANIIAVTCFSLPPLTSGSITYATDTTSPFDYGTIATYSCNSGFALSISGNRVRTCERGSWSGSAPACQPIMCPSLPSVTNGTITYGPDQTADYDFGTVAQYTCDSGFYLNGDVERTCSGDGTSTSGVWSGADPGCMAIVCPSLPSITNGVINYSPNSTSPYNFGTVALYACNEEFILEGHFRRTCGRNGTWNGTSPICKNETLTEYGTIATDMPVQPNSNSGVTAAAVVIVLIILVAVIVIVTVVITLLVKRQSKTKRSLAVTVTSLNAIDNQVYGIGDNQSVKQTSSTLTESQDHTYEFDALTHNAYTNEYAYSGPFEYTHTQQNGEIVYESPLDGPAISYSKLLAKNKEEDIYVSEDPYEVPASIESDIYTQLNTWGVRNIKSNELQVIKHLGSGQFGSVEQGVWKRQGTGPVDVALKSLTKTSEDDKVKFLQEAAIMAQFRHPNVIMIHGVVVGNNPMLVVELAKKGDLRELLISMRPDPGELVPTNTPNMLTKFSQQVALGMQYLSAKGFVHRDLAARNVLVTSNSICKVADFGLSRDLADENYYVSQGKDKIPVKWTAPEAIHYKKYSTASDVWAYGCLLYEIWSLGHKPFEKIPSLEAIRLVDNGKRLSPPPGCPSIIYELMIHSWHPETSQRPSFRDIVLTLSGSEKTVLNIPEEDSSTNPLAAVLGAPLEAGENMYSEQKRRYETQPVTDGDYF